MFRNGGREAGDSAARSAVYGGDGGGLPVLRGFRLGAPAAHDGLELLRAGGVGGVCERGAERAEEGQQQQQRVCI